MKRGTKHGFIFLLIGVLVPGIIAPDADRFKELISAKTGIIAALLGTGWVISLIRKYERLNEIEAIVNQHPYKMGSTTIIPGKQPWTYMNNPENEDLAIDYKTHNWVNEKQELHEKLETILHFYLGRGKGSLGLHDRIEEQQKRRESYGLFEGPEVERSQENLKYLIQKDADLKNRKNIIMQELKELDVKMKKIAQLKNEVRDKSSLIKEYVYMKDNKFTYDQALSEVNTSLTLLDNFQQELQGFGVMRWVMWLLNRSLYGILNKKIETTSNLIERKRIYLLFLKEAFSDQG